MSWREFPNDVAQPSWQQAVAGGSRGGLHCGGRARAHGSSTSVRVEGEKAKQELIYALTVASESLQTTKQILTR